MKGGASLPSYKSYNSEGSGGLPRGAAAPARSAMNDPEPIGYKLERGARVPVFPPKAGKTEGAVPPPPQPHFVNRPSHANAALAPSGGEEMFTNTSLL